jgi:hypothetical protein
LGLEDREEEQEGSEASEDQDDQEDSGTGTESGTSTPPLATPSPLARQQTPEEDLGATAPVAGPSSLLGTIRESDTESSEGSPAPEQRGRKRRAESPLESDATRQCTNERLNELETDNYRFCCAVEHDTKVINSQTDMIAYLQEELAHANREAGFYRSEIERVTHRGVTQEQAKRDYLRFGETQGGRDSLAYEMRAVRADSHAPRVVTRSYETMELIGEMLP